MTKGVAVKANDLESLETFPRSIGIKLYYTCASLPCVQITECELVWMANWTKSRRSVTKMSSLIEDLHLAGELELFCRRTRTVKDIRKRFSPECSLVSVLIDSSYCPSFAIVAMRANELYKD
jgi:hypothetical protein